MKNIWKENRLKKETLRDKNVGEKYVGKIFLSDQLIVLVFYIYTHTGTHIKLYLQNFKISKNVPTSLFNETKIALVAVINDRYNSVHNRWPG